MNEYIQPHNEPDLWVGIINHLNIISELTHLPAWTKKGAINVADKQADNINNVSEGEVVPLGLEVVRYERLHELEDHNFTWMADYKHIIQMLNPNRWYLVGKPSEEQIMWCLENGDRDVRREALRASSKIKKSE